MESDEKPEETAKRELKEELGIIATPKFLFSFPFSYADFGGSRQHVLYIFHVVYAGLVMNCEEFQWSGWKTKEQVNELAASGLMCPDTKVAWQQFKALNF